jgi:hypothetical protein
MATIVTRETTQTDGTSPKGSPLTNAEVDTNFINLNDDKVEVSGAIIFQAKAGEALAKGDVVYVSGVSGNEPVVSKADADDASKMPAYGLAEDAANLNAAVNVVTFGTLYDLDTSSFSAGDTVYVSTTAGAITTTAPTGESSLLQNIGTVIRSHASAGSIKVGGAGRTNATPNLDDGNVFIGNASNQAEARALTGDDISGGTITSFASTGIDDNATSTAVTINSVGRVLIGRTDDTLGGGNGNNLQIGSGSGGAGLTIHSGSTSLGDIQFADGTSGNSSYRGLIRYLHQLDALDFWTAGTQRVRIDADGETSFFGGGVSLAKIGNIGPSSNSAIRISRADSTVSTGNPLGYLEFGSNDATNTTDTSFAYVAAEAEGTFASADNPTALVFGVTANGSGAVAEAMRITNSGELHLYSGTIDLTDQEDPSLSVTIESTGTLGNGGAGYDSSIESDGQLQLNAASVLITDNSTVASGFPAAWNLINNGFSWGLGSTEYFTINSSGNIGIGETNPQQTLHLTKATAPVLRFERDDTTIAAGNGLGQIQFAHKEAGNEGVAATLRVEAGNSSGSGMFVFQTGLADTVNDCMYVNHLGLVTIDPSGGGDQITHELSVRNSASPRITIDHLDGTGSALNSALLLRYSATNAGTVGFTSGQDLLITNELSAGDIIYETPTEHSFTIGGTEELRITNTETSVFGSSGDIFTLVDTNLTASGSNIGNVRIAWDDSAGTRVAYIGTVNSNDFYINNQYSQVVLTHAGVAKAFTRSAGWGVTGTIEASGKIVSNGSGLGNAMFQLEEVGNNPWNIMQFTGGDFSIQYNSTSSAASSLFIKTDGKVGLGTVSPQRELQINLDSTTTTTLGEKGGIEFYSPSSTAGNGGEITWSGGSGNTERYAAISGDITTNTVNGSAGEIHLCTKGADTDTALSSRLRVLNSGRVYISENTETTLGGFGNETIGGMNVYPDAGFIVMNGDTSNTVLYVAKTAAATGNYVHFASNGTTRGAIVESGTNIGISFGTSSVGVNTLDDYEEGTYTVRLYDAGTGGNQSANSATGYYTKIGRLVTVNIYAFNNIDTTGMTSSNAVFFNLPFTSGSNGRHVGSVNHHGWTYAAANTNYQIMMPQITQSATRGYFVANGYGVGDQTVKVSDIGTGDDIVTMSITYHV